MKRFKWLVIFIMLGVPELLSQTSSADVPYKDLFHYSKVFEHNKYFRLYLPATYETSDKRYPVVYFFHGWGGRYFKDDNAKLEYEKLQALVDKYKIILVLWDGNIVEEEPRPYNIGNHPDVKFEVQMKDYFPELVAYIDSTYRTITDRKHRGIIGFSMGGFMSFFLAGKYPQLIAAAANLHGSPEFFVGNPENHTLYPIRYTLNNLSDVGILLHNSLNDELYYLNEEVNKAAVQKDDLHYQYELFPGDHKIDDPGKTEVFEKALAYVADLFNNPVPLKSKWNHYEIYSDFTVWGYEVNSDKNAPGFIFLKDVTPKGMGIYTMKWLPDGPSLDSCNISIKTPPVYLPNTSYSITKYCSATGKVSETSLQSNDKGELALQLDVTGYEIGIHKKGDDPDFVVCDYELLNGGRFLNVDTPNKIFLKVLNRTEVCHDTLRLNIVLSSSDSTVFIDHHPVRITFIPGARIAFSEPLSVSVRTPPPEDASPYQIGIKVFMQSDTQISEGELHLPVFYNLPEFKNLIIDDGVMTGNVLLGEGDGDGVPEPGEKILIYEKGHRMRLFTDDPYIVKNDEKLIDEIIPAKWPDGYTLSSVVKISDECPKNHKIKFMCNYEQKTFMPIKRSVIWGIAYIIVK